MNTDIVSIVMAALTLTAAVSAVVMGLSNSLRIHDLHISLNSRLDQLLTSTGSLARAEGREEARQEHILQDKKRMSDL